MKQVILAAAILAIAASAHAQHSSGYVSAGIAGIPGKSIYTYWHGDYVNVGGGGEKAIGRRFTIGGEIGGLISTAEQDGRSAVLLSVGPAFHFFSDSERKLDPFVNGGATLLIMNGVGGMVYYGGGLNYWFHRRIGLRVEFRDHVWTPESGSTLHFTSGRIGVSFR